MAAEDLEEAPVLVAMGVHPLASELTGESVPHQNDREDDRTAVTQQLQKNLTAVQMLGWNEREPSATIYVGPMKSSETIRVLHVHSAQMRMI